MNTRTEEEQIEVIKSFIQQYGSKILLVIVLVIASYFGFQSWQDNQQGARETASIYYSELSMLATAADVLDDEQRARFDSIFARLAEHYPSSVYAAYGALFKARIELDQGQLDQAGQSLQWILDNSRNNDVKALATLRLARVELARGEHQRALALLGGNAGAFVALYEQAKGDVYLDQGDQQRALTAYRTARSLQADPMSMSGRMLDIKIESMGDGDTGKLFSKPDGEGSAAP